LGSGCGDATVRERLACGYALRLGEGGHASAVAVVKAAVPLPDADAPR